MEKIFSVINSILQLIVDWPKRKAARAAKDYAQWRSRVEVKKMRRSRTAGDIVKSVDELYRKNKQK